MFGFVETLRPGETTRGTPDERAEGTRLERVKTRARMGSGGSILWVKKRDLVIKSC